MMRELLLALAAALGWAADEPSHPLPTLPAEPRPSARAAPLARERQAGEEEAALAAAAQDAAEILGLASARHRSLRTLQASFTQRIRNPILERDETSTGVFSYQAPLRYRIAFTRPPRDVIVSTGSEVWIYLPSSQPDQVIRSRVTEATKGFAPYQFIYDFKDAYEPALVGLEPVGGRPSYHLTLTPTSAGADYARAELWIDQASSLTRQVEVEEPNGVVRRFTLEDARPDATLPASLFSFEPPKGAEVFEQ